MTQSLLPLRGQIHTLQVLNEDTEKELRSLLGKVQEDVSRVLAATRRQFEQLQSDFNSLKQNKKGETDRVKETSASRKSEWGDLQRETDRLRYFAFLQEERIQCFLLNMDAIREIRSQQEKVIAYIRDCYHNLGVECSRDPRKLV